MIYAPTKFEVATSNGLGEDTITRNVMDGRTDGQTDRRTDGRTTDRLWYKINIPYFSYEKAGITNTQDINRTSCVITASAPTYDHSQLDPVLYGFANSRIILCTAAE